MPPSQSTITLSHPCPLPHSTILHTLSPLACIFYPVPCNDYHPNLTSRPQTAPLRTRARVSQPGPPSGSSSHSASRDSTQQPDSGTSALGPGERSSRPPTARVPPDPLQQQQRVQRGPTAHPPAPDAEADTLDKGTAGKRPGSTDPYRPTTPDHKTPRPVTRAPGTATTVPSPLPPSSKP